jgi:hypothetical protein
MQQSTIATTVSSHINNTANATSELDPAGTIAPYATALNGVSQNINMLFRDISWLSLGILAVIILTIRLVQRAVAHSRHMGAMGLSGDAQRFWAINRYAAWWKFKKHILYAPLKGKRHNREIRLSKAGNMGTIPSRFHTILIIMFLLGNIVYCAYLDYKRENKWSIIAELRGRTGVMSVVNMLSLVIFAGRNNPLIAILQISFDTYNLLHRWIGRMIVLQVLVHTLCWAIVKQAATGWSGVWHMMTDDPFIGWGTVGTTAMFILAIQALSPIRHAFYETFLDVHIILAFIAFLSTWIHCKVANLAALPWVEAAFVLWVVERTYRVLIMLYTNYAHKQGMTRVSVEAMPGEACRVTFHLPKYVKINPGTHAYVRFAGVNPWESHPFSIAWVQHKPKNDSALPINEKAAPETALRTRDLKTDASFIIQAQTGMTRRLYETAMLHGAQALVMKGALEGPYAGHHSLDSYGHAVLFAGASGITHQISYVQHLLQGFNDMTVATRRITLIWIIRDSEQLEWVAPWMNIILAMPQRREVLRVKLFVTRPKNPREIQSVSRTVDMTPGRPNVKLLLNNEVKEQKGAMCVTVCGPGGLADNVREAVRDVQELGVVDFVEESFTW